MTGVLKVLTPDACMRVNPSSPPFAFTDTATRADGPLGPPWTFLGPGTWAIDSDQFAWSGSGVDHHLALVDTGERACDVSLDVPVVVSGSGGTINGGPAWNIADIDNFFYIDVNAGGAAVYNVTAASVSLVTILAGGISTYRVVHEPDGTLTVFRGGAEVYTGTWALHPFGTGVGMRLDNPTTRLDNFTVTSIRSPGRLKLWTGTAWAVECDPTVGHPLKMRQGASWTTVAHLAVPGAYDTAAYDTDVYA